ncbi:hypothetical protein GCM10022393_00360 [Aquimarina addita]|uniref:YHYH domain-containing protein n=1 Tax=Aquimarina addita TaxID=870485 RepID=A0ABP7X788_9FLAO
MKKFLLIITLVTFCLSLSAHEKGHGVPLKEWKLTSKTDTFKADFIKYENDKVWLSDASHQILTFDFSDFSVKDQEYIEAKHEMILMMNTKKIGKTSSTTYLNSKSWLLLLGGALLLFSVFQFFRRKRMIHTVYGILGIIIISFVSCGDDDSTDEDDSDDTDSEEITEVPANDLSFLASIFESFSGVTTSSDDTYFYISSNGLPDHNMMVGITSWQQQVPIDIDYTGDNSWAIPIQPVLAENPLSTETNLLRGAIAIAANGIPIFNPLNNRGEDANAIGELDQWGGHSGRADDYHYHVPPTHLQSTVGEDMPIAYALDGFPVYGETTEELDEYLGRFNEDGSYQYHTISEAPYFIAGMRGEVTLDPATTAPENQVIPQAMTQPLREAGTPLAGAEIVDFETIAENSYSLTYTVDSENYMVNYSWDDTGLYTYEFVNPDGTSTVETYQR